jgi:hypothetical protein
MARIIEAQAVITAKDGTGQAFASVAQKLNALGGTSRQVAQSVGQSTSFLAQKVGDLSGQIQKIDGFRALHQGLVETRARFNQAQAEVIRLGRAVDQAVKPTRELAREYDRAQQSVSAASRAFEQQRAAVSAARADLSRAGIPLERLGAQQDALRQRLDRTTAAMRAQQMMAAPAATVPAKGAAATNSRDPQRSGSSGIGAIVPAVAVPFAAKSGYDRAIEFERSINATQARAELTPEEAAKLRKNARTLGAKGLGFAATQVSELQRAYAQAGFEREAEALALPTMQFSAFGDVDPFKAADYTVSAMKAFRVPMGSPQDAYREAKKTQDILAKGANISRLGVSDFADGFKIAAPIAAALGLDREQTAAMIGAMGQGGVGGSEGGVAVRSMLVRLVRPTADSRQVMAEMGLKFDDYAKTRKAVSVDDLLGGLRAQGIDAESMRDALPKVIQKAEASGGDISTELSQALIDGLGIDKVVDKNKITKMVARYVSSLGDEIDTDRLIKDLRERGVTGGQMARIFDAKQAARLSTVVLGDDYQKFEKTLRHESAGASERGAAIMNQGAVGSHNRIVSSFDNLILSLAESGVLDTVAKGLDAAATGLKSISELSPRLLEFATYAGMATAALGGLGFVGGMAAKGGAMLGLGGLARGALGAGPGLPTMARFGLYGGALYAGYKTSEALGDVGAVAAGRHFAASDPSGIGDLQMQLSELETKIKGIEERVHPSMRGQPNAEVDRMRDEAQTLRHRIDLSKSRLTWNDAVSRAEVGERGTGVPERSLSASGSPPIEAVVKPDQVKATLEGKAEVIGRFEVAPSSELIRVVEKAKQISASGHLAAGNGPGSVGRSMTEAAAPNTGSPSE